MKSLNFTRIVISQKEDEKVPESFEEAFDLVLECLKSCFEQESPKIQSCAF